MQAFKKLILYMMAIVALVAVLGAASAKKHGDTTHAANSPGLTCANQASISDSSGDPANPLDPNKLWTDGAGNIYQTWSFLTQATGSPGIDAPAGSVIDSNSCTGASFKNLKIRNGNQDAPIGAYIGPIDTTHPSDTRSGITCTLPPDITIDSTVSACPRTQTAATGFESAFFDDGGRIDVTGANGIQEVACITFKDCPPSFLYPNAGTAGGPFDGAGFVFTSVNAGGTRCTTRNISCDQKWLTHPNSNNLTSLIGASALGNFSLQIQGENTVKNGFQALVFITFKFPHRSATCGPASANPSSVAPGANFQGSVMVTNNSGGTWQGGENSLANQSSTPQNGQTINPAPLVPPVGGSPQRLGLVNDVPNNTSTTFNMTITAPKAVGSYTYSWQMFREQSYNGGSNNLFGGICSFTITVGNPVVHRVYAANVISILPPFVRDNFQITINLLTQMWPDAGLRSRGDGTKNLWLAGIWGNSAPGGPDIKGNSSGNHTDPMQMGIFNDLAEINCPGPIETNSTNGCGQRVPLAYVQLGPNASGSGGSGSSSQADINAYCTSIATAKDGDVNQNVYDSCVQDPTAWGYVPPAAPPSTSGTDSPNGNVWKLIRDGQYNNPSNTIPAGCAANASFTSGCGGFASDLTGLPVSGAQTRDGQSYNGNYLNNVEISNIHILASQLSTTSPGSAPANTLSNLPWQGKLTTPSILQPDTQPLAQNVGQGPQGPRIWDNIKSLTGTNPAPGVTNTGNLDFQNSTGSPVNFIDDPANIQKVTGLNYGYFYDTSLLQDGNGNGYKSNTESLSYTGSVKSANVNLAWDEYVDWSQVDDKGHWYTTQTNAVTGVYQSSQPDDPNSHKGSILDTWDAGGPVSYKCDNDNDASNDTDGDGTNVDTCSTTSSCSLVPTAAFANASTRTYYAPNQETRFGWLNSSASFMGKIPYGGQGGTALSHFAGYQSSSPPWATIAADSYWQDTSLTTMDNSGSTNKLAHLGSWNIDSSDPMYSGRQVFDSKVTVTIPDGIAYSTTQECGYPSRSDGTALQTKMKDVPVSGIYSNQGDLYENTASCPSGMTCQGMYNFTKDGNENGQVDTGWAWASNLRRVHYENTWKGHTRDLGQRQIAPDDTAPTADCSASDTYFLGIIDASSNCLRPSRGNATIVNPTLSTQNNDILGTAGISGYFNNSTAGSAFLYSNCGIKGFISNFGNGGVFPGYYNNPDSATRTTFTTPTSPTTLCIPPQSQTLPTNSNKPIYNVFGATFDTDLLAKATAQGHAGITSPPTDLNLNNAFKGGGVYRTGSGATLQTGHPLTISGTQFCNGAGTIIVEGDLIINGDTSYCGSSTRTNTPSVGFIVNGNVTVASSVHNIVGAFFVTGQFNTGTIVVQGNTTTSDPVVPLAGNTSCQVAPLTPLGALNVCGLIVANSFSLDRQPSGSDLAGKTLGLVVPALPEQFIYDGRVAVNPPPGFSQVISAPAVWNEGIPYNTP